MGKTRVVAYQLKNGRKSAFYHKDKLMDNAVLERYRKLIKKKTGYEVYFVVSHIPSIFTIPTSMTYES